MNLLRAWLLVGLMMGVGIMALPAQNPAKGQAKKGDSPPDTSTKGSTLGAGVYTGVIENAPRDGRLILCDIPPPKVDALNKVDTSRFTKAQKAMLQKAKTVAQAQKNTTRKELEFLVGEKVPIRFKVLAQPYDDKGNIVVPGKEMKEKLKGPGIEGTLDQIRPGHLVRVEQINEKGAVKVKLVTVLGEMALPK